MSKVWSRCLMTNKKSRRPRKNTNLTAESNQPSSQLSSDRQKLAHSRLHENPRLNRPTKGVRAMPKKRGRQNASRGGQNTASGQNWVLWNTIKIPLHKFTRFRPIFISWECKYWKLSFSFAPADMEPIVKFYWKPLKIK